MMSVCPTTYPEHYTERDREISSHCRIIHKLLSVYLNQTKTKRQVWSHYKQVIMIWLKNNPPQGRPDRVLESQARILGQLNEYPWSLPLITPQGHCADNPGGDLGLCLVTTASCTGQSKHSSDTRWKMKQEDVVVGRRGLDSCTGCREMVFPPSRFQLVGRDHGIWWRIPNTSYGWDREIWRTQQE